MLIYVWVSTILLTVQLYVRNMLLIRQKSPPTQYPQNTLLFHHLQCGDGSKKQRGFKNIKIFLLYITTREAAGKESFLRFIQIFPLWEQ